MAEFSDLPIPKFIDVAVQYPYLLQNRHGGRFKAIAVVLDRGGRSGLLDDVVESMVRLHSLTDTQVLLVVPARPATHPPKVDSFWVEEDASRYRDRFGNKMSPLYLYRDTGESYFLKDNQYWNRVQRMRKYGARGAKAERELKTEIALAVNEIRDYLGVSNDVIPSVLILCLDDHVAMFLGSGKMLPPTELFTSLAGSSFGVSSGGDSLAETLCAIGEDVGLDERIVLGALKPEVFAGWSAEHLRAKPLDPVSSEKSRG